MQQLHCHLQNSNCNGGSCAHTSNLFDQYAQHLFQHSHRISRSHKFLYSALYVGTGRSQGMLASLSILQVDLSAVCTCLNDVRLFTVYQSDEIRSRWRKTPAEGQGPQWSLAVAKWRSSATKAAVAIVEGREYIALLVAAFDRVFDSDQELQELAGHTSLREVLRTELLPRRTKAIQTNLLKELSSIISSAFVPVYQGSEEQDHPLLTLSTHK